MSDTFVHAHESGHIAPHISQQMFPPPAPQDQIYTIPNPSSEGLKLTFQHRENVDLATVPELPPAGELGLNDTFSNPWVRFRWQYREYMSEFLATMILIIFGTGVNCQVILSLKGDGNYVSILMGWGIGVMAGVYVGGGISGGHLNPAVTICFAAFRGFPWKKVPGYTLAQIAGAFCGACITQALYTTELSLMEGGTGIRTFLSSTSTASLFFTAVQPDLSNLAAFWSDFSNTAVLMILLFAILDQKNMPVPAGLLPVVMFFVIAGIGASLGWQTAFCLNPARDLGPRIAAAAFGYPSSIWSNRNQYWIWGPWIATILGALSGCLAYDVLIYQGNDSWVNMEWGNKKRQLALLSPLSSPGSIEKSIQV